PAGRREELGTIAEKAPGLGEQPYIFTQRVGNIHVPAVAPQLRVVALRGAVMQDQEVADALVFELSLRVIGLLQNRIEIPARKEVHQPEDPGLGEEYGG